MPSATTSTASPSASPTPPIPSRSPPASSRPAAKNLAAGASEQAASLEEISASLEEMASMTCRNSEGTAKAKTFAGEALKAADTGAAEMVLMAAAIEAIKTASKDISKIIKTIDEIAFQSPEGVTASLTASYRF